MERAEIVMNHLTEEWDNIIVLCSRYNEESGTTELFRVIKGNAYAVGGMMEETMMNMSVGLGEQGANDGEEEQG